VTCNFEKVHTDVILSLLVAPLDILHRNYKPLVDYQHYRLVHVII